MDTLLNREYTQWPLPLKLSRHISRGIYSIGLSLFLRSRLRGLARPGIQSTAQLAWGLVGKCFLKRKNEPNRAKHRSSGKNNGWWTNTSRKLWKQMFFLLLHFKKTIKHVFSKLSGSLKRFFLHEHLCVGWFGCFCFCLGNIFQRVRQSINHVLSRSDGVDTLDSLGMRP